MPDIGNGFFDRVNAAVLRVTGAEKTLWSGKLRYSDPRSKLQKNVQRVVRAVSGIEVEAAYPCARATADGDLLLDEDEVVRPLAEMWRQRGKKASPDTWNERRRALKIVIHEFGHLAVVRSYTLERRIKARERADLKMLEEATTEAGACELVDAVAALTMPPDLAAGIASGECAEGYTLWTPAGRTFTRDLSARLHMRGNGVLWLMYGVGRDQKGMVAGNLVFRAAGLEDLVPREEQPQHRRALQTLVEGRFMRLSGLRVEGPGAVGIERLVEASEELGSETAETLWAHAGEIARSYRRRSVAAPARSRSAPDLDVLGAQPGADGAVRRSPDPAAGRRVRDSPANDSGLGLR